ncbi:MAG: hypothetical protein SVR04_11740 [Spirochaetota bacterium]|nr:hypothetical protein [Spirochaetota bacterium]
MKWFSRKIVAILCLFVLSSPSWLPALEKGGERITLYYLSDTDSVFAAALGLDRYILNVLSGEDEIDLVTKEAFAVLMDEERLGLAGMTVEGEPGDVSGQAGAPHPDLLLRPDLRSAGEEEQLLFGFLHPRIHP